MSAASDAEATASGDVPDPSKLYATARKLSTFLISRAAIVPVAAAALAPMVAAGATQLPIRELLKIARGLLLLWDRPNQGSSHVSKLPAYAAGLGVAIVPTPMERAK